MGIELRYDRYPNMRSLSNQSPSSNLFEGVLFSVDLFFGRRRLMNITGAVAENPRFRHIKTVLSSTAFNIPFHNRAIVSSPHICFTC